jgi:hypothetical protein
VRRWAVVRKNNCMETNSCQEKKNYVCQLKQHRGERGTCVGRIKVVGKKTLDKRRALGRENSCMEMKSGSSGKMNVCR